MTSRSVKIMMVIILLAFMIVENLHIVSADKNNILYYEYGSSRCPHCVPMHEFLQRYYPNNNYFCDISLSSKCANYFTKYLEATGLPGYVPQVIIVKNMSYVLAIVIGEVRDKDFFDNLTSLTPSTEIPVYEGETLVGYLKLKNMTVHQYLVQLLYLPNSNSVSISTPVQHQENTTGSKGNNSRGLVSPITYLVPLALSDSVNPCTIAIYTILLATVSLISRRKAITVGILFIIGVFIGYTALGLTISYGLSFIDIPQEVLAFVLIFFGFFLVFSAFFRNRQECKVCKEGKCAEAKKHSFLYEVLKRAETKMMFSLFLGLLVSFTLLPCSMGPYIVFLVTLRNEGVPTLPYILLYNVVFALPLYIVLVSLAICKKYVDIEKYRYWIYLIAGILLIILGVLYFI